MCPIVNTTEKKLVQFASCLHEIMYWGDRNFPGRHTSLAQHVMIWLAHNYLNNSETTLKSSYLTLPFSERAIRLYLRQLEKDGWIVLSKNTRDLRYKNLYLTEKFKLKFHEYHMKFQILN